MIWNCTMSVVEWNKKEDLVQEQAVRHLRQFVPLFVAFSSNVKSELALLNKIQVCGMTFLFFHFPFYPLSSFRPFLPSFHTDWISRLGLGNQVGSNTDHLSNCYLPSTPKDRSTRTIFRFNFSYHIMSRRVSNPRQSEFYQTGTLYRLSYL